MSATSRGQELSHHTTTKLRSDSIVESVCENSSIDDDDDEGDSSTDGHRHVESMSAGESSTVRTPSSQLRRAGSNGSGAAASTRIDGSSNHTARTHLSFVEHHQATPPVSPPRDFKEHERHQQQLYRDSAHAHQPSTSGAANNNMSSNTVPADQERQILLLMLLAQVCALHDPTPRTFTVHVLELFERGILSRDSINFLYDLGLVPSKPVLPPLLLEGPELPAEPVDCKHSASDTLALMVPYQNKTFHRTIQQQRSMEASAIRSTLEHHEKQQLLKRSRSAPHQNSASPTTAATSWSVDEHPLSLSRYQREFEQQSLLAAGSFGQVFRAVSKMDGREYAVKRVPFAAAGYSRDSVQQVVREVHCLAVCDHPHVVRYYTSWLEPSWMTGTASSGGTESSGDDSTSKNDNFNFNRNGHHLKLLNDIQHMITTGDGSKALSEDLNAYFRDSNDIRGKKSLRRRASYSDGRFDSSIASSCFGDEFPGDYSEWTINQAKDDLYIDQYKDSGAILSLFDDDDEDDIFIRGSSRPQPPQGQSPESRDDERPRYRYQICLFIQMQLCHPATLADWIRTRNEKMSDQCLGDRLESAAEIFNQVVNGLAHVHSHHIVHRDLKPSNIFASADGLLFRIGDFGLSKMIQNAASKSSSEKARSPLRRRQHQLLLLEYASENDWNRKAEKKGPERWKDPLTAGVGTASYAAPEQVVSTTYGTAADLFSLGLILLELLCCFSTEHERLQTFADCRHRRKLPPEFDEYPAVAQTILACTDPIPDKRPTAADLKDASDHLSCRRHENNYSDNEMVASLKKRLDAKEQELETCKSELNKKDRIIEDLQRQLSSVNQQSASEPFRPAFRPPKEVDVESWEPASSNCSSSSEDGI